jgi:hypothetical protein
VWSQRCEQYGARFRRDTQNPLVSVQDLQELRNPWEEESDPMAGKRFGNSAFLTLYFLNLWFPILWFLVLCVVAEVAPVSRGQ